MLLPLWQAGACVLVLCVALPQVVLLSGCPESPVWLEGVGRRDAADEACIRLWGARAILADPDYEADAARAADLVSSASRGQPGLGAAHSGGLGPGGSAGLTAPLLQQQQHTAGSSTYSSRRQEPSRAFDGGGGSVQRGSVGFSGSGAGGGGIVGLSDSELVGGAAADSGLEGWQGLLAHRYRLMMALAVGLPLLQQASGINTVVYYSTKVSPTGDSKATAVAKRQLSACSMYALRRGVGVARLLQPGRF